jgi:hypothetical protein
MMKSNPTIAKLYLLLIAVLGCFSLLAQLYLSIESGLAAPHIVLFRYFAYFTLTTNLLVAITCVMLLVAPNSRLGEFLGRQKTLTATTSYILVVGIIYNVLLRIIWKPEGLQLIVNELLHAVIPILFLIYWLVFVRKDGLKWNDIWPWLLYPLIYTIYVFIFGAITGFYPYHFIDLAQLGLKTTIINACGITIFFIVISLLLVGISKLYKKPISGNHSAV